MKKEYAITEDVAFGVMVFGKMLKSWFLSHGNDHGPAIFWTRESARECRDSMKKNGFPKARVVMVTLKYRDFNQPVTKE